MLNCFLPLFPLAAGLGIFCFVRGFKLYAKRKLMSNIPTSTARAAAMGLVEVKGRASKFRKLQKTPFSKMDSVLYHYKVEQYLFQKGGGWVPLTESVSSDCFYLEDETGKVLVNPVSAELHLKVGRKYKMGIFGGGKNLQPFKQGLEDIGVMLFNGLGGLKPRLRCTESYILPGESVYVIGTAVKNPFGENSAMGSASLCIKKEGDSFFCISDKSEKDLLRLMGWKMYLYLYGGPALAALSFGAIMVVLAG